MADLWGRMQGRFAVPPFRGRIIFETTNTAEPEIPIEVRGSVVP